MGIEVKNLIKSFGNKTILDNISFKVDDGKILSIVGFSGSGKSTVLKLISGLIEKDSGEIITTGGDIAMVFQYSALFDSLLPTRPEVASSARSGSSDLLPGLILMPAR